MRYAVEREELFVDPFEREMAGKKLRLNKNNLDVHVKQLRTLNKKLKEHVKELWFLNKNLKEAREKLREAERFKSEFMNIALNEFKNPIILTRSYLELLMDDKNLSSKNKEWITICLRNTNSTMSLIDDLLNVSSAETD